MGWRGVGVIFYAGVAARGAGGGARGMARRGFDAGMGGWRWQEYAVTISFSRGRAFWHHPITLQPEK